MPIPRMLFCLSALGILSVALLLAACGSSSAPELPDTTSASVLTYLEEVDYRNNDDWKLWPGTGEKYQGGDPTVCLLTTYLNPAAFEAIQKDTTTPHGVHHCQGKLHPCRRPRRQHCHVQEVGLQSRP